MGQIYRIMEVKIIGAYKVGPWGKFEGLLVTTFGKF
jgi:hypothetical protein